MCVCIYTQVSIYIFSIIVKVKPWTYLHLTQEKSKNAHCQYCYFYHFTTRFFSIFTIIFEVLVNVTKRRKVYKRQFKHLGESKTITLCG